MLVKLWKYGVWKLDIRDYVCVHACACAGTFFSSYLPGTNKEMICYSSKKSLKNKACYFWFGAEFPIQYLVQNVIAIEAKLHIVIGLAQHHSWL